MSLNAQASWNSTLVSVSGSGRLTYIPDADGNIIPDFSFVGYGAGSRTLPDVPVVEIIYPLTGDNRSHIQNAINRTAARQPDANGFRGAVLLKKGLYEVNGNIIIEKSGIVIRGEGSGISDGTVIREIAGQQVDLFLFKGSGNMNRAESSKVQITEDFVPTGRKHVMVSDPSSFNVGDSVLVFRPGTDNWIHDLKMDQIDDPDGTTVQWVASLYNLYYERVVTSVEGSRISLDNPIVMQMDARYGGGYLMHYTFPGRIRNCGIENLRMESTFISDTDEAHGWYAVNFSRVENGWARNVSSVYFGMGCVYIDPRSRNISVLNSQCLDAKSIITGSRRYSFNCDGQLNLFSNCYTTEGRHDYVTGSRTCGPNVFTRCKARNTHADVGPHHRWASGTLFDVIDTDGEINVQDRGDYGTGHGWAGVTQVLWNCKSSAAAVQSPWVSGKNYSIGLTGAKTAGRFNDRPDGFWEGLNVPGLHPESLYDAQVADRQFVTSITEHISMQGFRIYPNPTGGNITMIYNGERLNYRIYSISGDVVREGVIVDLPASLDLSALTNGTYLFELWDGKYRHAQKLIIMK